MLVRALCKVFESYKEANPMEQPSHTKEVGSFFLKRRAKLYGNLSRSDLQVLQATHCLFQLQEPIGLVSWLALPPSTLLVSRIVSSKLSYLEAPTLFSTITNFSSILYFHKYTLHPFWSSCSFLFFITCGGKQDKISTLLPTLAPTITTNT